MNWGEFNENRARYREWLKHPKWQEKRLQVLSRDGFTCRWCGGSDEQLQVHHLRYNIERPPWEIKDDLLITLCDTCHSAETHTRKPAERALLDELAPLAPFTEDLESIIAALVSWKSCLEAGGDPGEIADCIEQTAFYSQPEEDPSALR